MNTQTSLPSTARRFFLTLGWCTLLLGCGPDVTPDDEIALDGGSDTYQTDSALPETSSRTDGAPESSADANDSEPDSSTDANVIEDAGEFVCDGTGAVYVTDVVAHQFGTGQSFGQSEFPQPILGPPKGAGCCAGSTDVVSLGNGGWVIVTFENNAIVDEPGPDFIVFENAFDVGGAGGTVFAELATVSVSDDGVTWHEFPCKATAEPYGSCAGWHPVFANPEKNDIDPTDPATAGGDAFDLADVDLRRARFVKIVDRKDLDGANGVFDLDAVAIVHPACK